MDVRGRLELKAINPEAKKKKEMKWVTVCDIIIKNMNAGPLCWSAEMT